MRTTIKFLGALIILIIAVFSFGGCDGISMPHIHIFKQKMDAEVHFMECTCGESKKSEEHSFVWRSDYRHKECTTCGYIKDEDSSVAIDKNQDGSISLSDELVGGLKDYFSEMFVEYDIGSNSFAIKINLCKSDQRKPLLVKFSEDNYYVAAYFAAPEDHFEHYCCYTDYTFVGFEKAEDIKESWEGKAIVGAFVVNPYELCVNVKTGENSTVMDHVSFYNPEFKDGVSVDPNIDFDNFFIYLTSKDEDYICYSSTRHKALHMVGTIDTVELDGSYYVMEHDYSYLAQKDLELLYGDYYEYLMSIVIDKCECNGITYRGLYKLAEIVDLMK